VIPEAWSLASPETILEARFEVVDPDFFASLVPMHSGAPTSQKRQPSLGGPAMGFRLSGEPFDAGHAALPWPGVPHLDLWPGITLVKEFRGDAHNAIQVAAGFDGCDAMVMHRATHEIGAEDAASRGWSPDEWEAASAGLRDPGLLDTEGLSTEAGRTARQQVEDRTDEPAMAAWERIGTRSRPSRCECRGRERCT
jgi:hypothetical protein